MSEYGADTGDEATLDDLEELRQREDGDELAEDDEAEDDDAWADQDAPA